MKPSAMPPNHHPSSGDKPPERKRKPKTVDVKELDPADFPDYPPMFFYAVPLTVFVEAPTPLAAVRSFVVTVDQPCRVARVEVGAPTRAADPNVTRVL
jgi:hypothetical protein